MAAPDPVGFKTDPAITGNRVFEISFSNGKPVAVPSPLQQYQEGHPVVIYSTENCVLIFRDPSVFGTAAVWLPAGERILLYPKVLGKSTGWHALPVAEAQRWTGDPPGIPA